MLAFSRNTLELHRLLKDREDEAHGDLRKAYIALLDELNGLLLDGASGRIEYLYNRLADVEEDIIIAPKEVVRKDYIEWLWNRYFDILKSIIPDEIDDGVSLYSLITDAQQEPLDKHLKSYRSTFMMYDIVVNFHSIYSFF